MTVHVFYLPFAERDGPEDNLRFGIRFDGREPTADEVRDLYEFVGSDEDADMDTVFDRWSAGARTQDKGFRTYLVLC